jgi:hypothetical protein
MPYFLIHVSQTQSSQYIVEAPNRETAEDRALVADNGKTPNNKTIIRLSTDKNASINISDAEKADWTEALKKAKAK